ncbi:MAG: hypothetical protein ACRD2C_25730, partial [Acidimicrobiales bacterium]
YVAGNLAARHNINVTLHNSTEHGALGGRGITVTINLPPTLLTTEAPAIGVASDSAPGAPELTGPPTAPAGALGPGADASLLELNLPSMSSPPHLALPGASGYDSPYDSPGASVFDSPGTPLFEPPTAPPPPAPPPGMPPPPPLPAAPPEPATLSAVDFEPPPPGMDPVEEAPYEVPYDVPPLSAPHLQASPGQPTAPAPPPASPPPLPSRLSPPPVAPRPSPQPPRPTIHDLPHPEPVQGAMAPGLTSPDRTSGGLVKRSPRPGSGTQPARPSEELLQTLATYTTHMHRQIDTSRPVTPPAGSGTSFPAFNPTPPPGTPAVRPGAGRPAPSAPPPDGGLPGRTPHVTPTGDGPRPQHTASGLTRRVPGAQAPRTQLVGLRQGPQPAGNGVGIPPDLPALRDNRGDPGTEGGAAPPGDVSSNDANPANSSAKDVYSFLSSFSAGVQRGLDEARHPNTTPEEDQ